MEITHSPASVSRSHTHVQSLHDCPLLHLRKKRVHLIWGLLIAATDSLLLHKSLMSSSRRDRDENFYALKYHTIVSSHKCLYVRVTVRITKVRKIHPNPSGWKSRWRPHLNKYWDSHCPSLPRMKSLGSQLSSLRFVQPGLLLSNRCWQQGFQGNQKAHFIKLWNKATVKTVDTEGNSILTIAAEFLPGKWHKCSFFKCLRKKTNFFSIRYYPLPLLLPVKGWQIHF